MYFGRVLPVFDEAAVHLSHLLQPHNLPATLQPGLQPASQPPPLAQTPAVPHFLSAAQPPLHAPHADLHPAAQVPQPTPALQPLAEEHVPFSHAAGLHPAAAQVPQLAPALQPALQHPTAQVPQAPAQHPFDTTCTVASPRHEWSGQAVVTTSTVPLDTLAYTLLRKQ